MTQDSLASTPYHTESVSASDFQTNQRKKP